MTVISATLYISGVIFEKVQKLRNSSTQPVVATVSASTDQPNQAAPQVQINNNQFNPEIITSRFMIFLFCFLVPSGFFFILEYHNVIELNEILPKMTNLGLTQAIFQLSFSKFLDAGIQDISTRIKVVL